MSCDNNLSCFSLVYAEHEKALCAARGAGCQLGLARSSRGAPRLHPLGREAWGCPGAEEGQQEQPPCRAPRLEILGTSRPSQALDAGHTVASGGHFTPRSSGQMFLSKENISSFWVPSSSRLFEWDPKLREVPRTGMSPETPNQALSVPACLEPRCPGGRAGLPLLHPLLPRERDPAPKCC